MFFKSRITYSYYYTIIFDKLIGGCIFYYTLFDTILKPPGDEWSMTSSSYRVLLLSHSSDTLSVV